MATRGLVPMAASVYKGRSAQKEKKRRKEKKEERKREGKKREERKERIVEVKRVFNSGKKE